MCCAVASNLLKPDERGTEILIEMRVLSRPLSGNGLRGLCGIPEEGEWIKLQTLR